MRNFMLLFALLASTLQHANAMALTRPATSTGGMEGLGRFMGTIEIKTPVFLPGGSMTPDISQLYKDTTRNKKQKQCLTNKQRMIDQNSSTEDSEVTETFYNYRPVKEISVKNQRSNKPNKEKLNYSTPNVEDADIAVRQLMAEALSRTLSYEEIQKSLDKYVECLTTATFVTVAEEFEQNEEFCRILIFLQQIYDLYHF